MRLEKKLFLSVGSLFIIVAVISYVLPFYLSRKNINTSERNILAVFGKEVKARAYKDLSILNKALERSRSELTAAVNFYDHIGKSLSKDSKEGPLEWVELSFFLEHSHSAVDYVSMKRGSNNELSYVIDPYIIDPVQREEIWENGPCWISTRSGEVYVGLPYINPEIVEDFREFSDISVSELHENVEDKYVLFSRESLISFIQNWKNYPSLQLKEKQLNALSAYLKGQEMPKEGKVLQVKEQDTSNCPLCDDISKELGNEDLIKWTRSSAVTLLDFLLNECNKTSPYEEHRIKGIACFFSKGMYQLPENLGLFYSKESLFPQKNTFKLYHDAKAGDGERLQRVLIDGEREPVTFIGQEKHLSDGRTLLMGRNIKSIVRELYLDSNEILLILDKRKALNGYDATGMRLKEELSQSIAKELNPSLDMGIIRVGKQVYSFSQHHLNSVYEGVHIYILRGINEEVGLFKDILFDFYQLLKELGWQLFIVVIVAILLALVLLHFISKRITRSLAALAKAANKIGEDGAYDQLPAIDKGHDEVAVLSRSFHYMVDGLKAKDRLRSVLDKVVSKKVADEILSHPLEVGGEERNCSVLFIDIRGFTAFAELVGAKEVVSYINDFMGSMTEVIEKHGGVVDKFIGDAVMALFGAPIENKDHALNAVNAGLEMIQVAASLNGMNSNDQEMSLHVGVGIHSGVMVVGNMGSKVRMNYTAIGRGVNLASRICDAAGPDEIMISKEVLSQLPPELAKKAVLKEGISLKGVKSNPKIYSIK